MNAYRSIFRLPGALAMTSAALIGRLPMAMTGLAVTLLVVSETGRYGLAGAVAGVLTLTAAVGGPVGAGLSDRLGQHRVIPPLMITACTSLTLLTVAVMAGTPLWTWLALAALAGLTSPNLGAMIRARWAHVTTDQTQLGTAFALESTLDELAFVVGPVLATALAVVIAPGRPSPRGSCWPSRVRWRSPRSGPPSLRLPRRPGMRKRRSGGRARCT